MIYAQPPITSAVGRGLAEIDALRTKLHAGMGTPARWVGTLRREVQADAVASSTAIEGFSVAPEDAVALVSGRTPPSAGDDDQLAVASYAHAMDHVAVLARDPSFRWLDRVILDLHFEACAFQHDRNPGLWRTGPVAVTGQDGRLAYFGPDAEDVPALMGEVVDWLAVGDQGVHPVVRAAMAHLHLVSIHPFEDGNGRVARIVQSLVLARDGVVWPEFGSIESYLAENITAYYAALQDVQGGSYQPDRDASGWVDFCIHAHRIQALRRLEQIEQAASRWAFLERLVEARGWPDRLVIALEQSLVGGSDRMRYRREADVSVATASNDFRRLLDAGLVVQRGRGRLSQYRASDGLRRDVSAALRS